MTQPIAKLNGIPYNKDKGAGWVLTVHPQTGEVIFNPDASPRQLEAVKQKFVNFGLEQLSRVEAKEGDAEGCEAQPSIKRM